MTAKTAKCLVEPVIAMISFSNFDLQQVKAQTKVREAVSYLHKCHPI
jgi:malate dehydrogenase (oxaloacetate-decarboxylating)(NADP+)